MAIIVQLSLMDFVILDELGYLPFAQSGGQLLFYLISLLYERTSIIVNTNLALGEWPNVFHRCARQKQAIGVVGITAQHRNFVQCKLTQGRITAQLKDIVPCVHQILYTGWTRRRVVYLLSKHLLVVCARSD